MTRRLASIILSAIAGAALIASAALAQQQAISIGTGGTGGVYYPMGGAIANALSKYLPGVQATAEVTGASVDNLKLIGSGQSEVGFTMADTALEAVKGVDKFKGNKVDARTLLVLYPNRMHVVTTEGSGIEKMTDLKGKRVSTGSPGSGTEVTAFRLIEAAGLDRDKDMKRERLSVAESVNAIKDGKIDAFFWVGGLPTAAVTDLGATPGVKIKMIDQADLVEKTERQAWAALRDRRHPRRALIRARTRTIRSRSCGTCWSRATRCPIRWLMTSSRPSSSTSPTSSPCTGRPTASISRTKPTPIPRSPGTRAS